MADTLTAGESGESLETPGEIPTKSAVASRRWVTAALLLVMILASMEATVTSTAMPTIVGALKGLEHYSWVGSIYLLASTITMPLYGRLADLLGRKRVLMFSITLFAAGSVFASMSQTMWHLILFRALQGLGAGGIMPVVLTILGDIFTMKERAAMQAVFSAVWGTSALAGPALGWFLISIADANSNLPEFIRPFLGWRSIFWVNLPTGIIAMIVLAFKYHEKDRTRDTKAAMERLDLRGILLLGLSSTALLVGVSLAAGVSVPWWVPAASLLIGVIAAILFLRRERIANNPVMPPALMMRRAIGPSMIVSGLLGIAIFSIDTYVPLYVQGGRGWSAAASMAAVTPVMLAWALTALAAMPLMMRWGFRRLVMAGAMLLTLSLIGLVLTATFNGPLWLISILMFFAGAGISPCSMGTLLAAQDSVEYDQRGIVTSSVTFFRNFGGALGVGAFGALFNILSARPLREIMGNSFSPGDLLDPEKLKNLRLLHPELLTKADTAIAAGLYWVFIGMVALAVVMFTMSTLISSKKHIAKPTGEQVIESMD